MNLIDLLLLLVMLLSLVYGYRKGFILGTLELVLLVLSIGLAVIASFYVAAFFDKYVITTGVWSLPLAFFVCFIFTRSLLSALVGKMIGWLTVEVNEGTVNKALGIIPGAINGFIYSVIISAVLVASPMFSQYANETHESVLVNKLTTPAEWVEGKLSPVFAKAINNSSKKLTVTSESETSFNLPFSVKYPKVRADLEAEMLIMINNERRKEGLRLLKADPEIRVVARAHSKDMFEKSYFSHINKEGETPADRVRKAGVRFFTVGENLALAPTLEVAHTGLMNSPGHRANILYKSFGRVGIAVLEDSRQGLMITQNFRN